MRSSFTATLAALFIGAEAGRHAGSCSDRDISGVASFNQNRYSGRWFEVSKEADFYDEDYSCSTEDIVVNFNGTVTIAKSNYSLDYEWEQKELSAILSRGKLGEYIAFGEEDTPNRDGNTDFYVLATDYESWAVEYICIDLVPGRVYFDGLSIKSRSRELTQDTASIIELLIASRLPDYDFDNLHDIVQCRVCPYQGIPIPEAQ